MTRRAAVPLLLLAAGCFGCGLGDYEDRIDQQQKRIKRLDEENKALGDAIALPGKKENDKDVMLWPFDVYLRVPRGIGSTPAAHYTGLGCRLPLVRYRGAAGSNVFVAAGLLVDKNKDGVYQDNEWTLDQFRRELLLGLKDYYAREYRYFLDIAPTMAFKKETRQPVSPRGEPLAPLVFDTVAITDDANRTVKENSAFLLFHHVVNNHQVGVIYQIPKANLSGETTLKAIDYSLKSLDILNATLKRQQRKT